MIKLIFSLILVVFGLTALPASASAQRYDPRIDVPRVVAQPNIRDYGLQSADHFPRELERLNRDVRRVRLQIRASGSRGRRVRPQFDRIIGATDQLNAAFRNGTLNSREIRSRTKRIGFDLDGIRKELRLRQ